MRILSILAAAMCLSPLVVVSATAAAPPVQTADTPTATASTATAPAAPGSAKPSPATPATPASGDAAAKHAKRTACLKDAKAKKLVGAAKTSFLKNCVTGP
jgi:hypothetical protein